MTKQPPHMQDIIKLISQICSADLSITLDELNQFMKTLEQIFTDLKGLVS